MDQVIAEIDAWWNEKRVGMDTEAHNREAASVQALKDRIAALAGPAPEKDKKGK